MTVAYRANSDIPSESEKEIVNGSKFLGGTNVEGHRSGVEIMHVLSVSHAVQAFGHSMVVSRIHSALLHVNEEVVDTVVIM